MSDRDNGRNGKPQLAITPSQRIWTLQHQEHAKVWSKRYRTEIAATAASLTSTLLSYPLDSIKTRLQLEKYSSWADCVRKTYANEHLKGFYRGLMAPLGSVTFVRTFSFSVYQRSKYTFDRWIYQATGVSPLVIANQKDATPTLLTALCFGAAGGVAGGTAVVIACPFELAKLSSQSSMLPPDKHQSSSIDDPLRRSYQGKGAFRTGLNLVRHRGIAGLYSGFNLHLVRDTIGTAAYFASYETAKQLLANARGHSPTTPLAVATAGAVCGLASWAAIYPIDVAKAVYQRNCLITAKGRTTTTKIDYWSLRSYQGMGVSMARSCIVNAIFFSVFEYTKKRINRLEIDQELLHRTRST